MKIALINSSTVFADLTGQALDRICGALNRQISEHYAPMWQSGTVPVQVGGDLDQDTSILQILDTSDQAGALGYHATIQGRPYGKIFAAPIKGSGGTLMSSSNSLSVTISHEVLEMIGDPYIGFWSDMDGITEDALELCDRVQADAYAIDGVFVSDFLGPRAFSHGAGPYDYLGLLKNPFDIRPGGYAIRRTGTKVKNVFGQHPPLRMGERRHARGI